MAPSHVLLFPAVERALSRGMRLSRFCCSLTGLFRGCQCAACWFQILFKDPRALATSLANIDVTLDEHLTRAWRLV